MQLPQNLPPNLRLSQDPPAQCKNGLKPRAFIPKEGEGLSVYRADMRTPRSLIAQCLDDQKRRLSSDDEDARKRAGAFIAQYGDTIEKLVASGWRVARIPASAFTTRNFTIDGPEPVGHPNCGHQNVYGAIEDFQTNALIWMEEAELLTPGACLQE